MTTLLVQIGEESVPLAKCDWIRVEPCGCINAVTMAALGDDVIAATAEQAHKELVPLKRDRDRELKRGWRMELITHAAFRERTKGTGFEAWNCAQHKKPATEPGVSV